MINEGIVLPPENRETEIAIQRALTLDPAVPGAGRLCQELLSELTGLAITREIPPAMRLNRRGLHMQERRCGS